ncbi:MAG: glycosyltransferase family 25 protein [Crocosphaera sp.]|nr:glycosyltransferase family 25 protein [Crocosphaera sp.]
MNSLSSFLNFFDQSYIINLPERLDRRRDIQKQLKRLGECDSQHTVNFFPAIKPTALEDFPSIGARGCFLSHLEVLKKAKQQNVNNLLIMEDDLSFSSFLVHNQEAIINELQSLDWDIVYFGHAVNLENNHQHYFDRYDQQLMLAHFLCFKKQTIERLIDFLETVLSRPAGHPEGGPMHVDGAYSTFRSQNPDLITLIATPNLGYQRSSISDISGSKWFDKVPILSQLAVTVRNLKNWGREK